MYSVLNTLSEYAYFYILKNITSYTILLVFKIAECLQCMLNRIQYLQTEPSEKVAHLNESMMLKMFYLYGFVRWTKCIWWTGENNYLLDYMLFEFAVEWIPATRIKQKYSSIQKTTCTTTIGDKKIISLFCVSGVLSSLPLLFRLNSFIY